MTTDLSDVYGENGKGMWEDDRRDELKNRLINNSRPNMMTKYKTGECIVFCACRRC